MSVKPPEMGVEIAAGKAPSAVSAKTLAKPLQAIVAIPSISKSIEAELTTELSNL